MLEHLLEPLRIGASQNGYGNIVWCVCNCVCLCVVRVECVRVVGSMRVWCGEGVRVCLCVCAVPSGREGTLKLIKLINLIRYLYGFTPSNSIPGKGLIKLIMLENAPLCGPPPLLPKSVKSMHPARKNFYKNVKNFTVWFEDWRLKIVGGRSVHSSNHPLQTFRKNFYKNVKIFTVWFEDWRLKIAGVCSVHSSNHPLQTARKKFYVFVKIFTPWCEDWRLKVAGGCSVHSSNHHPPPTPP